MRISDWSSDVCSSDLNDQFAVGLAHVERFVEFGVLRRTGAVNQLAGKRERIVRPPERFPAVLGPHGDRDITLRESEQRAAHVCTINLLRIDPLLLAIGPRPLYLHLGRRRRAGDAARYTLLRAPPPYSPV